MNPQTLEPQICDFGLALFVDKDMREDTQSYARWAAPEVFEDWCETDEFWNLADVYSFGLIVGFMITGLIFGNCF